MKFSTKAIHKGQEPDTTTGSIIPPIYMTSTYIQDSPGSPRGGYEYTRSHNPNFTNLETTLANLDNGKYAKVFNSGLSAITTLISTLESGDHVLAINDLYGGTYRLFHNVYKKFGIHCENINVNNESLLRQHLEKKPKMLFIESPTNPLLTIVDIQKICDIAHSYCVKVVVDNTFSSPYVQKPLDLGADIVLYSSTKYIGGHSDVIGGAIIQNKEEFDKELFYYRNAIGFNPSPFDTWLLSRSCKTLAVRMKQHSENGLAIARYLSKHSLVKKVYYPGLSSHEGYEIATKQMNGYSGIVSVDFALTYTDTCKLISSFSLFQLAESLGGVESLVDHPASMTHASIPKSEREKIGLSDGLIRLSVGIEDIDDLVKDLDNNLRKFM